MKLRYPLIGLLCGLLFVQLLGNTIIFLFFMGPVERMAFFISNNIVATENWGQLIGIVSFTLYGLVGLVLGCLYGLAKRTKKN